jgi:hypothetical protein
MEDGVRILIGLEGTVGTKDQIVRAIAGLPDDAKIEDALVTKAMDDYYTNLTDEEIAEDRTWGQFGLEQASKAKDWA